MIIGFVFDDSLDSTDGVQQYILALGDSYRTLGHEVHYLVGESSRKDIPNVHSLSKNVRVGFNKNVLSTPLPASKKKINQILKSSNFDVLHVQVPYSPFMAGRVLAAARKLQIPVVGTFHILPSSLFESLSIRALGILSRRSTRAINKMLAVSPPAKVCAETAYRLPTSVVPNPVNSLRYRPKTPKAIVAKKLHIVFVGRLVSRKGCRELLKTLAWLHERGEMQNVRVSICGDGAQRSSLELFVSQHGLASIVAFKGRVSEQDKISILQSADIAVFPSLGGESFGIVLIEAMAAGVPAVIAGDNPGYRSVMDDNELQLVDPRKTDDFASRLRHFITSTEARADARAWQKKRLEQFDIKRVSSQVLEAYDQAIAKSQKD